MPWKNLQRDNVFLHFIVFIFLILIYWPNLNGPFFTSDDAQLILLPQFSSPVSLQNFISIFTPGNHLDFYPVRDLSYFLDTIFFNSSPFLMRLENLVFLFIGYLYFFKLFTIFNFNLKIKAIISSAWIFSFYQLEQVMWLSARKDLLALTFAMISIYYFFEQDRSKSKVSNYLWPIFYLLSILSKATFGLLPLFYLFHFLLISKNSQKIKPIITCLTLMLVNGVFQSWFYSNITDMTYRLAYLDRFHISMSALGRMLLGMIYYPVNAIDFFNFGDWLTINQKYEWIGVLFILISLVGFTYSIYKKRYNHLLFIFIVALLYFPISGLIFPHKMFYSTRYLIPIYFLMLFGVAYFANKLEKYFYLFVTFLIFNLGFLWVDLANWKDNLSIRLKAVNHSSEGIYPKTQLLLELMGPSVQSSINKLQLVQEIDQKCREENNLSCLRYYLISKDIFKNVDINKSNYYWTKYMLTINLYQYNKKDILNNIISDGFKSSFFPMAKLTEWTNEKKYLTNAEERIWKILSECIKKEDAISLKNNFIEKKLIRSNDLLNFIESELSPENQKLAKLCLKV